MTWVVTAGDRAAPCERVSVAGCVDDITDVSFPSPGAFVKRRYSGSESILAVVLVVAFAFRSSSGL